MTPNSQSTLRIPARLGSMISAPRRILIADHHTAPLPDLGPTLSALGHTVVRTSNVLETIDALTLRKPDLVLLAPLSPNPLGKEVGRVLEVKDQNHCTPLILICDHCPDLETMAELSGSIDSVVIRDDLTENSLLRHTQLVLGHVSRLRRLEHDRKTLERQSITDFKTGTFNDRHFHQRLREEYNRSRRSRTAISCVMFDFDNFKDINDSFDHAFGDFVLLAFSKKLRSIIRNIDIPARLGGDEFALLLPNTGLDEAVTIAERIRKIVSAYAFENEGRSTAASLSIGISSFDGVEDSSPEDLLRKADAALLEAKRRGRNRVIIYPQIGTTRTIKKQRVNPESSRAD